MKLPTNLEPHPAFQAWNKLHPGSQINGEIEVIKNIQNTFVIRIILREPDRLIIAKRAKTENLKIEEIVYTKIIPECSFSSVQCYGLIAAEEKGFSWLFLEHAKGEQYDQTNKHHKISVLRWLGELHTIKLPKEKISLLPDTSLDFFFNLLQKARSNILNNITNPNFNKEDISCLHETIRQLAVIENNSAEIYKRTKLIPLSLIHGSVHPKNVRIQQVATKFTSVVFDWESSGWGTPIFDLGSSFIYYCSKSELKEYYSNLSLHHTHLQFEDVINLIQIGRVLKVIKWIYTETRYFDGIWVRGSMKRMPYYHQSLLDIYKKMSWI